MRLAPSVQSLHIYLKEAHAQLMIFDQAEDILRWYQGGKVKSVVDNAALYISLHKLPTTGQLSKNAQIIDRNKVMQYLSRLHYYLTRYNIDVYLMGTKDHLSDYASRHPTQPFEQFLGPHELPTCPLPANLPLCTKCDLYTLPEDPHMGQCDGKM